MPDERFRASGTRIGTLRCAAKLRRSERVKKPSETIVFGAYGVPAIFTKFCEFMEK